VPVAFSALEALARSVRPLCRAWAVATPAALWREEVALTCWVAAFAVGMPLSSAGGADGRAAWRVFRS